MQFTFAGYLNHFEAMTIMLTNFFNVKIMKQNPIFWFNHQIGPSSPDKFECLSTLFGCAPKVCSLTSQQSTSF